MTFTTVLTYLLGTWLFGWGMGQVFRIFIVQIEQWTA